MIASAHHSLHSILALAIITPLELAVFVRILLRPHRDPASRIAWIVVVGVLPLFGILAYLLLGEVNIGRGRVKRLDAVLKRLPQIPLQGMGEMANVVAAVPEHHRHLFLLGQSISGFPPVAGNTASLLPDSNATIDAMVADIDSATEHVHVLFYIWLPDHNGTKVVEALKRAAARGVTCRVMADDLGSRTIIRSEHWQAMRAAGVRVAVGLAIGNPFLRPFEGRIDLRNHRKIVVIDDRITYCGSQNCADPEFRVKAKFAPWVDAVMRFEGPIARQNQFLFASDWMTYVDENLDDSPEQGVAFGYPGRGARAGDRHGSDRALLGHARDFRILDVRSPAGDRYHHPLLCAGRVTAERALHDRLPGSGHDDRLSRSERLRVCRGGQPQLLRGVADRGGQNLRICGRPVAHEIVDYGWRGHLDRLGEHGPP